MKVFFESIHHFTCDRCRLWWSVASYQFALGTRVFCPHCGAENFVAEIDSSGNVRPEELNEVGIDINSTSTRGGIQSKEELDQRINEALASDKGNEREVQQ